MKIQTDHGDLLIKATLFAQRSYVVVLVSFASTVGGLFLRRRVVELVRHLLGVLNVFVAVVLHSTSTSPLDVLYHVRAEWLDVTAVVDVVRHTFDVFLRAVT